MARSEDEPKFSVQRAAHLYDHSVKETPGAFVVNDRGIPTRRVITTPASPVEIERAIDSSINTKPKSRVFYVDWATIIEGYTLDNPPPGWFDTKTPPRMQREIAEVKHDPDHATSKSGQRQIQKSRRIQTGPNSRGGRSPQGHSRRR